MVDLFMIVLAMLKYFPQRKQIIFLNPTREQEKEHYHYRS